jgi:hypothetical protein
MATARTPLYIQLALASCFVIALNLRERGVCFFRSTGLMEHLYGWMTVASWLVIPWLFWELAPRFLIIL